MTLVTTAIATIAPTSQDSSERLGPPRGHPPLSNTGLLSSGLTTPSPAATRSASPTIPTPPFHGPNRRARLRGQRLGLRGPPSFRPLRVGRMSSPTEPPTAAERVRRVAVQLAALAQNGLEYCVNDYDRSRYDKAAALATELVSVLSGPDA